MPACRTILSNASARVVGGVCLLLGFVAGSCLPAFAHDYWLEPDPLWAARGESVALHLQMGGWLKSEEDRPLQKDHVSRFDLFGDQTGRKDLLALGKEGVTPVARVRLESASALAVMDRPARPITMEAERFNKYLTDEGQDAALAQRAQQGQTDQPGREIYSRYLKTLIQERDPAAATPNTLYKRRVGQRLEILLENDPRRLKPDGSLTVKVLFDGRPLTGAKVFACRRGAADDQPSFVLTAATSSKGLAEFKLDQPGQWLVRLVHLRAAAPAERRVENAPQWESFWAAYTFGVRLMANPPPGALPANSPASSSRERRPAEEQ